ncbi:MAG: TetR/AcrR family transcriptional regulator [Leuconostoc gelidum]|jgi:TetR/AcrR family transcriptional repressor of mexAB-oprM operon|uniref:TetR/AcrR family transcriptional regulator n=1 Tax=Leuconostoc gelidum subsp. gelidum TaxID=1607839 RepID=A0AB35G1B9_LEUGE|nr:TetR/AcrR family transcriptional regulator [Leuconostoc gelidum]AFS39783.1 TetR family transcriptional regulator [Leuconostoc gelidum JB7]MBZ5964695.1 TetR/AcrR family transcriptional regulator [Leuconostoc gelidum subsp. gelidum]MBZ5974700.1 TetR/AcrR family transcriptional regulator [Leuconostoc gelidum subsp. gelidum]MBZ5977540.1 TetR/AcrR family transcriptional regulator [Leuconostoc gelidum subsp. gelidum]MBZ5979180.1 TetR/AcrR family transcriptional regulator [Leuconostoc gelidum subs
MITKKSTSEVTRERILLAATELFLAKGYEQTTTREITKVLNITQPALYHYFGDKEALFVEVIKRVGKQVSDSMHLILSQTYEQPRDQLVAMTQVIVTRHPRDVFTLIHGSFNVLSLENQRELGIVFGRDYVKPIAIFFDQEALKLRQHVDSRVASSFYITSLAPLFGDFHRLNGTLDMTERIQQLLDLILYGVSER